MTKVKVSIKLILLIAAVALLFSACSTTESFDLEYIAHSDSADLAGFDFLFSVAVGEDTILGYNAISMFGDIVKTRIADVETTLNCTLNLKYGSGGSNVFASIMSGGYYCDAIMDNSNAMTGLLRTGGCLIGISTLSDYIDYRDTFKWGTPKMQEAMFWKDDLYAVLPASWPELLYGNSGYPVLVNENLVAALGVDDPREYLENDEWTWDKFEEVLPLYTQMVGTTQVYGMSVHPPYYGEMFIRSNGNTLIERDENGNYVCGWYTQSALEAMTRGQTIMLETYKDCFFPGWENSETSAAFINNQAVLYPTWSFYVVGNSALSYQMDNLGLVPFPHGPKAKKDVYTSVHEGLSHVISIPVNTRDEDASAMIIDALFEPLPGYETEEEIKDYLAYYDFFDPRDAEVFFNMFHNTQYAFYFEGARKLSEAMTEKRSITEVIEANREWYESIFDGILIPTQQGIDALWGDEYLNN